jgi:glycosyltransferase involved in cell wall biosynthesis
MTNRSGGNTGDPLEIGGMSTPLTIALVCSTWPTEATFISTLESDVLRAALATPSAHKFVVYPDTKTTRALVAETGATARVAFVKAVRNPRLPRRFWRRAKRIVRRRGAPLPFSALNDALVKGGASCAWLLGGSTSPIDMPYAASLLSFQHRMQPWFPEVSSNGEWRERERLLAEYVGRAAAVIVGTTHAATTLHAAYGTTLGGVHVLPLPTPAYALEASWRARGPRPSDLPSRYLFYPAQFEPHKNHVTAIRVIAALSSGAAPPGLVLVGADRGTQAHVMREAEALGVAGRVRTFDVVDRDRLIALYEHAEALLYPSLFGPESLPPLEAMALGCPVIAARVPGAEEHIADAGILVDAFDVEGYAAAVRTLRHDRAERDAMVERGLQRAREWTPAQYAAAGIGLIEAHIAPFRDLWA